jgi:hypothetical protein
MFWHIVLAHLLGDYPLQTDWMVENKNKLWGLGLHIAVHLSAMLILVGDARKVIWPQLVLIALIHFVLDQTKTSLGRLWPNRVVIQYLTDQFLHIASIFLVSVWIDEMLSADLLPTNLEWPIYAIGYLLVTYVWYITERTLAGADQVYQGELEKHFWGRMTSRAVMLSLFLLVRPGWGALGLGITLPYLRGTHRQRALAIDLVVALSMAVFINLAV